MTLWNPKKPRQLVAEDCPTDLNLSDAMQMVAVGLIFWCDHCHGYHAVTTPISHARPEGRGSPLTAPSRVRAGRVHSTTDIGGDNAIQGGTKHRLPLFSVGANNGCDGNLSDIAGAGMTPLFLDPPEPRRLALGPTPHPPLAAIDVHPCGPSARRWVFTFKDGTTVVTMDPEHAQLISQECFPAGPPRNQL